MTTALRVIGLAAALALPYGASANDWRLGIATSELSFEELHSQNRTYTDTEDRRSSAVFVRSGPKWFRVTLSGSGLCLAPSSNPIADQPFANDKLTDGEVVRSSHTGGIRTAWLAEPTRRYRHGVIGDDVEAAGLRAIDGAGKVHAYTLSGEAVFEDRYPRLADIDGRPGDEAVVVQSDPHNGARIVVFGLRDGTLQRLAASEPIGQGYRWLNPVGIADFDGDGAVDIAIVRTPHIGGILEIWSFRDGKLKRTRSKSGYSNHWIGSRDLAVSAIGDVDGDGRAEIIVPDQGRWELRFLKVGNQIEEFHRVGLPSKIGSDMAVLFDAGIDPFVVAFVLVDGRLAYLSKTKLRPPSADCMP